MLDRRSRFLVQDIRDWRTAGGVRVVGDGEVGVLLVAVEEDGYVVKAGFYVAVVGGEDRGPGEVPVSAYVECYLEIVTL